MKTYNKGGTILLLLILLLSTTGLTGCSCWKRTTPATLINTSEVTRIHKGELPNSPAAQGWLLSDGALATLLERAERPCK